MKTKQPECSECEKLSAVSEDSNKIGNFMDWLSERGLRLARREDDEDSGDCLLFQATEYQGGYGTQKLLAEYFEIDMNKVEQERRALLEWIRGQN